MFHSLCRTRRLGFDNQLDVLDLFAVGLDSAVFHGLLVMKQNKNNEKSENIREIC